VTQANCTAALPNFNAAICACQCDALVVAGNNVATASATCLAQNIALPNFNQATCACQCTLLVAANMSLTTASANCLAANAALPDFRQSNCDCTCVRWNTALSQPNITAAMTDAQKTSQAKKNASAVCVAENGPGWSFNQATCNCIFTLGTVVGMKFRGCPTFMHLDTDTNYPTDYFQDPNIYQVFYSENKVVDADPCSNKNGEEYQLRRLGTYSMEPQSFVIYPSPGDPGDVIYIQGKSRRTACLDRSFFQWTE